MALQYRALWNAGGSNPGFSVFHGRGAFGATEGEASQALADRVREFFDGVKSIVTNDFQWTFPGEVLDYDTSTGVLQEVHAVTPPAPVAAASTVAYSAASGARIEWRTSAVVAGRRLRGRTFLVPVYAGAYETDGTLSETAKATLASAAVKYWDTSLLTAAQPAVWSRTHGIMADIVSALIPDSVSILRSRRD